MEETTVKQFGDIVRLIERQQSIAVRQVNQVKTFLNWHLGAYISNEIRLGKWGDGTVRKLVDYIHREAPTLKGYSRPVIYHMVSFYETYSSPTFIKLVDSLNLALPKVPQAKVSALPRQLEMLDNDESKAEVSALPRQMFQERGNVVTDYIKTLPTQVQSMPYLLSRISWTNHVEILNHCDNDMERLFYILYYLEALDRDVKREEENPSIGILLCPDANGNVVHYAMNRSMSPTMIAQYKEHLIPKEVLKLSLKDFVDFLRPGYAKKNPETELTEEEYNR